MPFLLTSFFVGFPQLFRGGINWTEREDIPRGGALSREDFMGDYSANKIIILNKVNNNSRSIVNVSMYNI